MFSLKDINNEENIITKYQTNSVNKNNKNEEIVKFTFYITYAFLVTTATITFIEAMRTKNESVRHILNLETCISVVAAFFYGLFIDKINKPEINYTEINVNRYVDWSITTPIMLLVLILAFAYNLKTKLVFSDYLVLLVFNYIMLGFGFLGENDYINKNAGLVLGFGGFSALYYFIYVKYIKSKKIFDNQILFYAFLILWSLYGVSYLFDPITRNVGYNILDLLSKCFVGIFFWAYFTKVFILK